MTRSMQASLTAIGRQLNEDYQPTLAKPLQPSSRIWLRDW